MQNTDTSSHGSNEGGGTGGNNPPAGWYPDPHGSPQLRRWNGTAWTDELDATGAAGGAHRCGTCGQPLVPGDTFCASCGSIVGDAIVRDTGSDSGPTATASDSGTGTRDSARPSTAPSQGPAADPGPATSATPVQVSRNMLLGVGVGVVAVTAAVLVFVFVGLMGGGGALTSMGDQAALRAVAGAGEEFEEVWSEDADGIASAAVVDDAIVTVQMDWSGSRTEAEVVALATSDGQERFSVDIDDGGAVLIRGSDTILSTDGDSDDSAFTVLNPDGSELWSQDFRAPSVSGRLVGDDRVLVQYHDGHSESEAYRISDGERLWSADGWFIGHEGDTVVLMDDDELVVLDGDGNERWAQDVDNEDYHGAAVTDGRLFYGEDDELFALSLGDGAEQWVGDLDFDDVGWGDVQAVPGIGVLVRSNDGTEMWSLDGDRLWDDRDTMYGQFMEYQGVPSIVIVDQPMDGSRGEIEIYELETGQRTVRERLDEGTWLWGEGGPMGDVFASNGLLVKDDDEVTALSLDGEFSEMWTLDAGDSIGSVLIADDGIATVTYDNEGDVAITYFR